MSLNINNTSKPFELQNKIDQAFDSISKKNNSQWMCNGSDEYALCYIHEKLLMKKIVQLAPTDQKIFNLLDIGAGNFEWGDAMAEYLNAQNDLPGDIHYNIIGVRGEGYLGDRSVTTGRCTLYKLGAFKIEDLTTQLRKQNLELENSVDLAVSRMTFRHLVNPVGTFQETVNKIRSEKGFFLFDGFFFDLEDKKLDEQGYNAKMTRMMLDTKSHFLTNFYGAQRSLNHFILQRPDDTPCRLPMQYLGMVPIQNSSSTIDSCIIVRFQREAQEYDDKPLFVPHDYYLKGYYGNQKLYDWLKRNELMNTNFHRNLPVLDEQRDRRPPPALHQAVLDGDLEKAKVCLENSSLIDESDCWGNTPLHLAVKEQNWELFDFLLKQGANIRLCNTMLDTPLHVAAEHDKEGRFLERLISVGADIEAKPSISAVRKAIDKKNPKAVEILFKNGAPIDEWDLKALLSDQDLSSLAEIAPKPVDPLAYLFK